MTDHFKEMTKNNGLKQVEWGSEEFDQKLKIAETYNPPNPDQVDKRYIRPVDDKTRMQEVEHCDMILMQPLIDLGLWVYATKVEVSIWRATNGASFRTSI